MRFCRSCWPLNLMIFRFFSNLNRTMIIWRKCSHGQSNIPSCYCIFYKTRKFLDLGYGFPACKIFFFFFASLFWFLDLQIADQLSANFALSFLVFHPFTCLSHADNFKFIRKLSTSCSKMNKPVNIRFILHTPNKQVE